RRSTRSMRRSGRATVGTGVSRSATPCTSSTPPTTEPPEEASMERRQAIVAGLVVGVLASAGVMAAAAGKAPVQGHGRPVGAALAPDSGAGELLIAVVGGVFPSRQEAEQANEALAFGDLQGYYVVPVAQFQGFRQEVGEPGD